MHTQTEAARRARRLKAAERRFEVWAAEMREWGCEVIIPQQLNLPPKQEARTQ